MKLKVKITIVITLLTINLVACNNSESEKNNEQILPPKQTQNSVIKDFGYNVENLLVSLETEEVSLYYKNKNGDSYNGMYLRYREEVSFYGWSCSADELFLPELILLQEDQHVAINLVKEHGSGLHICEVHIIDLENMKEISVELPEKILDEQLKGTINAEKGKIYFKYDNKKIQIDFEEIEDVSNYFSTIAYGGIYNYYVENNVLYCEMGLQVSPAYFIGNMKIGYQYKDNEYKMLSLEFLPSYQEKTSITEN